MCKSQIAIRKGFTNNPSETQTENLRILCERVLQPVRDHFGKPVTVNSGYRCPKLNKAIGSSSKSQHTKGLAADIEIPGVSNKELAEYIESKLPFDQLILEFYNGVDPSSGWVHVSYVDDTNNRKQTLTINSNGTFPGLI